MSKQMTKDELELLERPLEFRYMLLSRIQSDCKYYVENDGGTRLWGVTVEATISYMKVLWESFPKGMKPQWLHWKEILNCEKTMLEIRAKRRADGDCCE